MTCNPEDRRNALATAIAAIEKQFGQGAIWQLDGDTKRPEVHTHTTGCLSIDRALGVGGLPAGRVVEIYGPESSGKTTLMLEVIAGVQRAGGVAAFVDAEHALDLQYASRLGVDPASLLVSQPDSGEQALEITDALVRSGAVDLVVIDSVAALVPRAELEGDMGDQHVGLQARLMSQALRKLTSTAGRSNTTVIFINQLRHKIGVTFGSPETTTGGNALKFYASVRLDIRRIGSIKGKDGEPVGNRTRVKVVKNKLAPPFRTAEFDIVYGQGVNRLGDLLDVAVEEGLIQKAGAWYADGEERLGQGRDRAIAALEERPDRVSQLQQVLRARYFGVSAPDAVDGAAA
ncbi:MAG: recombinase RecA [Myxococcales bacterium]|nr:recombinase RecA [Myxococcales bacterium]